MRIQDISDLIRVNIINMDDGNKKAGFFFSKKKKITGLTELSNQVPEAQLSRGCSGTLMFLQMFLLGLTLPGLST